MAIACLVTTATLYELAAIVVPDAPAFSLRHTGQLEELGSFDAAKALTGFPAALANALAPPVPILLPYTEVPQAHPFIITYRAAAGPVPEHDLHTGIVLTVLVLCTLGARWMQRWQRGVILAAALAIGYSWILHAWFGKELFLYSQHWQAAELVLLAAALWFPGRMRLLGYGILTAGLVGCIVNDGHVLEVAWHILSPGTR
jgi:hypothetical protein